MSAMRRRWPAALFCVLIAGCSMGTGRSAPAAGEYGAATTSASDRSGDVSVASVPSAPSLDDARAVALWWVASTGDLVKMGPIARSELVRERVASASAATMGEHLEADLAKLADRLPIPATELRLVETPITIDISVDSATGQARARVWSVVVFGARDLGSPRTVFRTSRLVLVVEADEWRLASFTSVQGPTPIAAEVLPSAWEAFAVVAGWSPASGGEG